MHLDLVLQSDVEMHLDLVLQSGVEIHLDPGHQSNVEMHLDPGHQSDIGMHLGHQPTGATVTGRGLGPIHLGAGAGLCPSLLMVEKAKTTQVA